MPRTGDRSRRGSRDNRTAHAQLPEKPAYDVCYLTADDLAEYTIGNLSSYWTPHLDEVAAYLAGKNGDEPVDGRGVRPAVIEDALRLR